MTVFTRARMRFLVCWTALVLIAGCATVPDVRPILDHAQGGPVRIAGRHNRPLTARQSKTILASMDAAAHTDLLQRHVRIEEAIANAPMVAGNEVRVLRDGKETFPAVFAAISSATTRINLEYYIFEDIQNGDEHLGDLLIAKRRQGVEINILYDSAGSFATPAEFLDRLKGAGIQLLEFNPLNPLYARGGHYSFNARDHRKILLVDGRTAIVGGVNLSKTYQSSPGHRSDDTTQSQRVEAQGVEAQGIDYWRDTDLQITGPVVAQLQQLFVEHWRQQSGPPLNDATWRTDGEFAGSEIVHILGTSPDQLVSDYYVTILSAIRNAERSVELLCAYFVPTHQEMRDLIHAARRGVEVRLVLPSKGDSGLALSVQHSHYTALLRAGVRIFETQNMVLHSKVVVVDGVWSIVGSSNFDHRSVLFNDEVDAVVLGTSTASQLQAIVNDDVKSARQIDAQTWNRRPMRERLMEISARLSEKLL